MCDCGDETAWKSNAFCSDHKGYSDYTDEKLSSILPSHVKERATSVFDSLCEHLHFIVIDCINAKIEKKS